MKIQLPAKVSTILQTLAAEGHEAFAVGGCVRDSIFGKEPGDWDITTSATPFQVKQIFERTIDTGIQHGTVTVRLNKENFEVTTYRIDGEYEDSRHPKEVKFTKKLEEDLKRRDFTVNAMAYNDEAGLIDLFGGLDDLQHQTIRCVGDPAERFDEDALRILRAVRFAAQLGFRIEKDTSRAIRRMASNLVYISVERIQTELVKLLVSDHPETLMQAYEMGITAVILPEFDACMKLVQNHPDYSYNVGEHLLKAVRLVPPDKVLRLTMLLHDAAKPVTRTTDADGTDHFYKHAVQGERMARTILNRLRFDNDTVHAVSHLIKYHDYQVAPNARSIRRAMNQIGPEYFPCFLQVRRADYLSQNPALIRARLEKLAQINSLYETVLEKRQCVILQDLAVDGKDLLAIGYPQGRLVGEALRKLLNMVLDNPEYNNREYLLERASEFLKDA